MKLENIYLCPFQDNFFRLNDSVKNMKELLRNHPVNMNDWMKYHPYTQPSQTDFYYLKLCNHLLKENIDQPFLKDLKWTEYKDLTCMLVCYFEDVISETAIWRSFTAEHQRLYGKILPFYDTDNDYYADEINHQDINFLVWHFLSIADENCLFNPFHPVISLFSLSVFEILETEYETAPQNTEFKEFLTISDSKDLFVIRPVMQFLMTQSFLNYHFLKKKMDEGFAAINKQKPRREHESMVKYHFMLGLLCNSISPMLALRYNEQLANMIGKDHPRYHEIKTISKRYSLSCTVKGDDDTYFYLEHIATGQRINLVKDTLSPDLKKSNIVPGKRLWVNVVKWGDEWALTGMMIIYDDRETIRTISDEKHLFDPEEPKFEMLDHHEECFKDLTAGNPFAYFANTKQYNDFVNRFRVHIFEKANPGETFPEKEKLIYDEEEDMEDIVMFFNHHSGTELYPDLASAVNEPRNPYYKRGETVDIQSLVTAKSISPEFLKYLIDNQLITFIQEKEMDDRTIIENLDFLMRYFKQEDYFSEPRVTIVNGQ